MTAESQEVAWVRLDQQIDAAWLDLYPGLKAICSPTTGLDHIDLAECQRRGIEVISLQGDAEFLRTIPATAELTVGLMLALLRKIPAATEHVLHGDWNRDAFRGRDLADCTVGIVGYGRIGMQVEERLRPFGCKIVKTENMHHAFEHDGQILCDIVTVHVPLNDGTRGFFGRYIFEQFKPGSYFINTSRGEIVDENALLDALESGRLAGAALDVVCNERGERNPRLLEFARQHPDRLIITPHIGGNSQPSRARAEQRVAEKLAAWKNGLAQQAGPA